MTRDVDHGLEVQMMYLPKSTSSVDFTLIPWQTDLNACWQETRRAAEAHKRDLSIFESHFWQVFGVTSPTIQSRIVSGNSKPILTGILKCDPKTHIASLEQYHAYLKTETGDPDWLIESMMKEALPHYFSRHVSDDSVYWVDNRTGVSSWVHPHYVKYSSMLQTARKLKPLSDSRSVAQFQFRCFFDNLCHPLLSLSNIREAARILHVHLHQEPYLTETIKSCMRFCRESFTLQSLSEFGSRIDRCRSYVQSLSAQDKPDEPILCVECDSRKAALYCSNCLDYFCRDCFGIIHASGSRKHSHVVRVVEVLLCDECGKKASVFHCSQCLDSFCEICFGRLHTRGGRRNHVPSIVRREEEFPDSSVTLELEKIKSVWVSSEGEQGGRIYTNLSTYETRRDAPLCEVNDFKLF